MRKLIFASILVLFLAFLYVLGSHTNSPDSSSNGPAAEDQPAFSVTSGNTTYYGAISSNVGVAILAVQSQPYMLEFGSPTRADGKFILVTVAITNRQHDAITMTSSLFEIVDSAGNVYSASEKSIELARGLFLNEINPGITKTGEIVFDVPESLGLENLRLKFRGGMTGDSAVLALQPTYIQAAVPPPQPEPDTASSNASVSTSSSAQDVQGVETGDTVKTEPQNVTPENTPATTSTFTSSCAQNNALGANDAQDGALFVSSLQTALRSDNAVALTGLIDFPLQLNKRSREGVNRSTISDPNAFSNDENEIFTPEVKGNILKLNPQSCLTKGRDGFTMGGGTFWFHRSAGGQFKLFALTQ
jgi:hypothetical protein